MKTVFLYQGPHVCHKKWAKAVSADFCNFRRDEIGEAEIILVEGGSPLSRAVEYKRRRPKTKIIYLNSDETFLVWKERVVRGLEMPYFISQLFALVRVDGIISVSRLAQLNVGIPEFVVHPFIQKRYEDPLYDASQSNILTVGYYHEKQGINLLVSAFRILKKDERFRDVKLYLVGRGYPQKFASEDIILTGFIEELSPVYKKCGVYVHAGKFQAFSIAVVEAMHYGLPVIVTNRTGVYEILDKRFVSTTDPEDIASKIKWLLLTSPEEKMRMSAENYRRSLELLEEKKIKEFTEAFRTLTNQTVKSRLIGRLVRLLPSYLFLASMFLVWGCLKPIRKVYRIIF